MVWNRDGLMRRLLRLILTFGVLWAAGHADARTWSSRDGSSTVEAELVSVKNQSAYLEKGDGSVVAVPLDKLSEADLDHLLSLPEYQGYFHENPIPGMEDRSRWVVIRVDDPSKVGEVRRFGDLGWGVESMAFSPEGKFLAVGKMDRAVLVYDVDKSERVSSHTKLDQLGQIKCCTFTPDGDKLLTGGSEGRIQIWSVTADGRLAQGKAFVGHTGEVNTISVSADGKTAVSGGRGKTARIWDIEDARELFSVEGFEDNVCASFINRRGTQALACDDETLALIDMTSGEVLQTMKLGRGASQSVAISPNGAWVTVSDSYALRVWDIRSGKQLPKLQDDQIPWTAVFSQNGEYVLAGGRGKVTVWEVATQRRLHEFDTAGSYYVQTIAYSPDQRHFAAIPGSAGQDVQVFRLPAELARPATAEPAESNSAE